MAGSIILVIKLWNLLYVHCAELAAAVIWGTQDEPTTATSTSGLTHQCVTQDSRQVIIVPSLKHRPLPSPSLQKDQSSPLVSLGETIPSPKVDQIATLCRHSIGTCPPQLHPRLFHHQGDTV